MKKSWILACSLAVIASAGVAQPLGDVPVTLAAIFAPAPAEGCALPKSDPGDEKVLAASMEKVLCQASCGSGTISCSSSSPSTCIAVDRNCPSQQGYVSCDGVTTYCSPACPVCTEGTTRYAPWGGACCEENNRRLREQQQCVNGQWVNTGNYICALSCDGIQPEYQ